MSKENIHVKKRNGRLQELDINKINLCVERACQGIAEVSASEIILDAHVQLYDKITTNEIDKALVMSARQKIEKEPNYAFAASRLLLGVVHKEVNGHYHQQKLKQKIHFNKECYQEVVFKKQERYLMVTKNIIRA